MALGVIVVTSLDYAAWWAIERIDNLSLDKERSTIVSLLGQLAARVPFEQASSAEWHAALPNLETNNQRWIADNLVDWISGRYGHDRVYVVAPNDLVMRAAEKGSFSGTAFDKRDERAILSIIQNFRTKIREASRGLVDLTPMIEGLGLQDFVSLSDAKIALISIRPIVPTISASASLPGSEFLLISVVVIDDKLAGALGKSFGVNDLHIVPRRATRASLSVRSGKGDVVGFLAWTPTAPARMLVGETALVSLTAITATLAALIGLLTWLGKRLRNCNELNLRQATWRRTTP